MPIVPADDWNPTNLLAKMAAGADLAQTQFCFNIEILSRYVTLLQDFNIPNRLPLLIGLASLASARQAIFMRENLFGTIIFDILLARLDRASDPKMEGRRICIE